MAHVVVIKEYKVNRSGFMPEVIECADFDEAKEVMESRYFMMLYNSQEVNDSWIHDRTAEIDSEEENVKIFVF